LCLYNIEIMTAKYNESENTLQELPEMERPENDLRPRGDSAVWESDEWRKKWQDYNAHISSLRTIPCENKCKDIFKDGESYEENVHHKAATAFDMNGENGMLCAVPLPQSAQEDDQKFGYWQLCPKCDGEGVLYDSSFDGTIFELGRTCPVCKGAKILARPVINNDKEVIV
jgi:hypothetical protein